MSACVGIFGRLSLIWTPFTSFLVFAPLNKSISVSLPTPSFTSLPPALLDPANKSELYKEEFLRLRKIPRLLVLPLHPLLPSQNRRYNPTSPNSGEVSSPLHAERPLLCFPPTCRKNSRLRKHHRLRRPHSNGGTRKDSSLHPDKPGLHWDPSDRASYFLC